MTRTRATRIRGARWLTPLFALAATAIAPAGALAIPTQTFTDPLGGERAHGRAAAGELPPLRHAR